MKSLVIGAALGALSFALSDAAVAAGAPAASASPHATTTMPAQRIASANTTAPATKQSATTNTTTTTKGPTKTGQPSQSCEDLGNQPGRSMSAPGSAFNPDGKAGSVYAGEQPQNSRNMASVSQYDVACARPSK